MTLPEIKQAIADGKKVHWASKAYEVIKDKNDQYLIRSDFYYSIGLTWADGITLNGKPEQFFISTKTQ